eukprot:1155966-Pelagomonas_calceolata.AAC.8
MGCPQARTATIVLRGGSEQVCVFLACPWEVLRHCHVHGVHASQGSSHHRVEGWQRAGTRLPAPWCTMVRAFQHLGIPCVEGRLSDACLGGRV